MNLSRNVSEIIRAHVTLEVESIDRMYLNIYQPQLQRDLGVVGFFRYHRGQPFAASSLMGTMTRSFVASIESFAKPFHLSEADKLNGIEWNGVSWMEWEADRCYSQMRQAWRDWQSMGAARTLSLKKKDGQWQFPDEHHLMDLLYPVDCDMFSK
jgi:hypothetical protein